MPDPSGKPPLRRPRLTPGREHELLLATMAVLAETGYEALTMEGVAGRARCGKATLYRLYGTKQKMIATAVSRTRPLTERPRDTGSLRGDLIAFVGQLALGVTDNAPLVWAVAHASLEDRELRAALRTAFVDQEDNDLADLVDRAVARGELSHRPAAAAHLPHLLFGTSLVRGLDDRDPAAPVDPARLVDDVLLPALRHS